MDQQIPSDIFFQCRRCTNCCRWPGEVKISDQDIRDISRFLEIPEAEFIETFTRLRHDRNGLALTEKPDGECIFLKGGNCFIQKAKPKQCVDFPNLWNFPGWRDKCHATPMKRHKNGHLTPLTEEQLGKLYPDLVKAPQPAID